MAAFEAPGFAGRVATEELGSGRTAEPLVDLIVLHWRNVEKTSRCLASLADLQYPNLRVIVVDNGSGDGSGEMLWRSLTQSGRVVARLRYDGRDSNGEAVLIQLEGPPPVAASVVLVELALNCGYAGGANAGLSTSLLLGGAAYFWLLNNDLTVAADAVGHLVERCRRDPQVGLCGALQLGAHDDGTPTGKVLATGGFRYVPLLGHFWHVRKVSGSPQEIEAAVEQAMYGVQGAAVFGTQHFLATVGLFEEDRFLYFEEQDWTRRAKRAGFRLGYAPGATVYHAAGSGFGHAHSGKASALSYYFMARSRLRFTRRHYLWALPTVCIAQLCHVLWLCGTRRGDEASAALVGMMHGLSGRWRTFPQLGAVSYLT